MGYIKSSSKREVYSNIGLPQERRKISSKQSKLPPKRIRKKKNIKPKVSRMKGIIKIREEINKIDCKIENINEKWNFFFKKHNL